MNDTLRNMTSLYLTKGDRILLLYRQGGRVVNEVWTGSAGGHFEPYELNDPQACALREMGEETGLTVQDIEGLSLRYITLRRIGSEIRQNYFYFAALKPDVDERIVSNEGICRWFDIHALSGLPMPYSARFVMDHYLNIGRYTEELYVGAASEDQVVFTPLPRH